jgi:hypothetical protein
MSVQITLHNTYQPSICTHRMNSLVAHTDLGTNFLWHRLSSQGVELTTKPHLVLGLKKQSRAIHLLPLWVFMDHSRVNFYIEDNSLNQNVCVILIFYSPICAICYDIKIIYIFLTEGTYVFLKILTIKYSHFPLEHI